VACCDGPADHETPSCRSAAGAGELCARGADRALLGGRSTLTLGGDSDTATRLGAIREETDVSPFRVDFESMEWRDVRPGVRHKVYAEGSHQLRLVEFATSDGEPHWCESGHIGYVLSGGLEIDFNGRVLSFGTGDGLFIPPGPSSAHRGTCIEPGTRLLMVEAV
jgi:hypothetical protein